MLELCITLYLTLRRNLDPRVLWCLNERLKKDFSPTKEQKYQVQPGPVSFILLPRLHEVQRCRIKVCTVHECARDLRWSRAGQLGNDRVPDRMQGAGDSIHAQRSPRLQLHAGEPHVGGLRHHERAAPGEAAVRRHPARALQGPGGGGLRGSQGGSRLVVASLPGHVHQRPEGVRQGAGSNWRDSPQSKSTVCSFHHQTVGVCIGKNPMMRYVSQYRVTTQCIPILWLWILKQILSVEKLTQHSQHSNLFLK